jgi:outer membrane protein
VSQCKLLSAEELNELFLLLGKPNQTDKDKERIKELQDQEKALDAELKDLQAKKEPNNQEKARQKELQDRQASADDAVQKLLEQAKAQFDEKNKALTQEVRNDILKAIEDVSKQKNLTMVLDKNALLYGGVDITQLVIDKLNGKKSK